MEVRLRTVKVMERGYIYSNVDKVTVKVVYVPRGGQYIGFITISTVTFCYDMDFAIPSLL